MTYVNLVYDGFGVNYLRKYLRKSSSVSLLRCESVDAKDLQHELLSEYEEQTLLRETQAGDEFARERLILCNLRFVQSIVQQYLYSLNQTITIGDRK